MVTLKEARRRLNKDELGNYPDMRNNADTLFKELNLKILTDEQFLELGDKVLSVTSHNDRRRWSKKDYRRNHYRGACSNRGKPAVETGVRIYRKAKETICDCKATFSFSKMRPPKLEIITMIVRSIRSS